MKNIRIITMLALLITAGFASAFTIRNESYKNPNKHGKFSSGDDKSFAVVELLHQKVARVARQQMHLLKSWKRNS
jgi:hypothetical protein